MANPIIPAKRESEPPTGSEPWRELTRAEPRVDLEEVRRGHDDLSNDLAHGLAEATQAIVADLRRKVGSVRRVTPELARSLAVSEALMARVRLRVERALQRAYELGQAQARTEVQRARDVSKL